MPHVPGVHLEGPYFSPVQAGAQDQSYIVPPVKEDYTEIVNTFGSFIKKYAFAPELPGSEEFCRYISDRGIIPSAGHTDCTYDDILLFDDDINIKKIFLEKDNSTVIL